MNRPVSEFAPANDNIIAETERWQAETRAPFVAAQPERRDPFVTQALKWPIKPLYTPADLDAVGFDYLKDVGFPGEYPYTRSTRPNGHRSGFWTMTQVTGFGKGEDWAKRARFMLDQGLSGLILEYDLATTNGYDSDDPMVEGEVGRAGMALDSLEDLENAFDLPFDKLKYLMSVCNAPQPVNLAMIIAALEKKGVDPKDFVLHIVNGILIEYTCVGRYIYPPEHGLRIATDAIEYIIRNHPNWAPLSIISAQLQPAKANPVQEIAFSLAICCAYIDATLERGLDIDTVAPYLNHFVVNVDMDFFEGICKLRAFRKCWARLMKERYGATRPEALKIRLMTSPTTIALTLQQPLNNIGRLAIMATACALGGAGENMTTPLHDEAHSLPAEEAIRVGAALQHIVAHETGVAETIDPLAGSYYVETLTKQMEDAAFAEMEKIFAMGGAVKAIETGYFQRALGREQYERNKDLEEGRRKWVGVNHLVLPEEKREIEIFRLNDEMEEQQVEKVRALRARRDQPAVDAALDKVREAARNGDNLVPVCLDAVKLYATHGELCNAMRDVFGVHTPDSQLAGV
ncbi:methylmalonyl-CoA mutase family protein [Sphingobium vermicomposti]|uniref:Methylmalonyl-CoA mutase N-terminal domain/subunit n=1 Tax=Sphingobium vermicomposti TaxID=529005 RepID=A0A846MBL4_9SPHN|nr:methylmalonyl-CoA mutase family protein [Sphingobium vermicomposti]NIJ18251.1 methylmalonyl-CoA mutase N-terminal domain/subunit [Sphingobium vermicomposti]